MHTSASFELGGVTVENASGGHKVICEDHKWTIGSLVYVCGGPSKLGLYLLGFRLGAKEARHSEQQERQAVRVDAGLESDRDVGRPRWPSVSGTHNRHRTTY